MFSSRFETEPEQQASLGPPMAGFLLMSVAPGPQAPMSTMQWLYQRLYEEAQKANEPKPMRDLFAVMN